MHIHLSISPSNQPNLLIFASCKASEQLRWDRDCVYGNTRLVLLPGASYKISVIYELYHESNHAPISNYISEILAKLN